MAEQNQLPDMSMDGSNLYIEEIYTDRRVGTIRRLSPVTKSGDADSGRDTVFVGQAQILTPMGPLPLDFEIDASSLEDAVGGFAAAAKVAVEQAVEEMKEIQRQRASSIVVPDGGAGPMGGVGGLGGGPGKLQIP